MTITSDLRGFALACDEQTKKTLLMAADRIDAEHEIKMGYWQGTSYKDGYDDGFASADDYFTDKRETLKEHGWVKLPVDADGVPIHVGDKMDSKVDYLFDGGPFEVRALVLCEDGWKAADGRFGNRYEPNSLRHHHPPTVEDVLEEMLRLYDRDDTELTNGEIVERYAAKLRLRGEDE